jgi:ribosomal protein S27E
MHATLRYYPNGRYPQARATCPNCEHETVFYRDDGEIPEREQCYYCGVSFWIDN